MLNTKEIHVQSRQKFWDKRKRPNLQIRKEEELQIKGTENIFNKKNIEEKFSNLKKVMPTKVREAHRMQNRLDKK